MVTIQNLLASCELLAECEKSESEAERFRHLVWVLKRLERRGYGGELERAIESCVDTDEEIQRMATDGRL